MRRGSGSGRMGRESGTGFCIQTAFLHMRPVVGSLSVFCWAWVRGCVGAYGLWLYPPIIPDPPIPYPPIPYPPIPYSSMSQFQELAADPSSDPPDPPYGSIPADLAGLGSADHCSDH